MNVWRTQTHLCVTGLALASHARAGWRSAGAATALRPSTTADGTRWPRWPVEPRTRIYKSNCTLRKPRFPKHVCERWRRHTDPPEQLWVLHTLCCRPEPAHSLPPLWGAGLSHWRVRTLTPPPQWAEHSDQGAHWLQLPSTEQPGSESHCRTPASHVLERPQRTNYWSVSVPTCLHLQNKIIWHKRHVIWYQLWQSVMTVSPGFACCQSDVPGHSQETFPVSIPAVS